MADTLAGGGWGGLSDIAASVAVAARDPVTGGVLAVVAGLYLITFMSATHSWTPLPFWRPSNASVWIAAALGTSAAHYLFVHDPTLAIPYVLPLLTCAAVGQTVNWAVRQPQGNMRAVPVFLACTSALLVVGALCSVETGRVIRYHGISRWTGIWMNPNTFGILMGVGLVLAIGGALSASLKLRRQERISPGTDPMGSLRHGHRGPRTRRCVTYLLYGTLICVLAAGLAKSYSRGAWLGAALAMGYLAVRSGFFRIRVLLSRNRVALVASALMFSALCATAFLHAELPLMRRILSIADARDFSWRKRLAAYEGGLQMIADKPLLGWSERDRAYDTYYRSAKVDEGGAIKLNDYLTIGSALGLPALVCFGAIAGLGLGRTSKVSVRKSTVHAEEAAVYSAKLEGRDSENGAGRGHRTSKLEYQSCAAAGLDEMALRVTCRASALVLLVGFFFDGGLFKLATGSLFWILMELGREDFNKCQNHGRENLEECFYAP